MVVRFFCVLLFSLSLSRVTAQILIPNFNPVTENFNGIGTSAAATLPSGWKMSGAGLGATANWADATNVTQTTQAANSGTPTTGGRYNWGTTAGNDRAIGFMTDANYQSPNAIMAHYRNTTGSTVSTWTITYNIERYRTNTNTFALQFFASTDGTTWASFPAGDIATSVFAPGSSAYSFTNPASQTRTVVINYPVPHNGDGYLKWVFINTNSTDAQGLGLDNVTIAAEPEPLPNPDLPISCPYDIIFILDESGSITGQGGGGATDISAALRNAASDLIAALSGTGTRVAVIEFGNVARRAIIGGSTAYQVVNTTYVTNFNTYIGPDGNSTQSADNYDPEDASQTTNWESAFNLVSTINTTDGLADMVIFLTDGRPTACTGCSGTTDTIRALNQAIVSANVVKTQGTHIFGVAIPNPVVPEPNMQAVTGPDRYPDLEPNFVRGDYSISSSQTLRDDLQRIAQSVCKVDLQIDKSAPSSACAGETIVFRLIVSNTGLDNDTLVVVKDTIPSGYTYVSDDGGAATTLNGNILTWSLATLAGGGGADTLNVTVTVNASGNHVNIVYVSGTQEDTDTTNNRDSFTVSISQSCDDGIPCTRDSCGAGGTCINTPYSVTASITPPTVIICAGASATLTASGSGGVGTYTFSWSNGATTPSITVSPASTTVFTVTVSDANRCPATASRTVTVEQAPNASISPQSAGICVGGSITLTASGGVTYSWSTGETTQSITVSPTSTTQYSVTVTSAGGCTASASRNVSVNQSPNVNISPATASICPGGSVTLTASGGNTYSWSTGETTSSITVSPVVTTTYTVTATNNQGCTATASRTVTVNQGLTAAISPATVAICAGQSATLTASGGTSFSWNTGATTASITVSPAATTTFSVTVSDASGCSATASRTVTVNPLPAASISPATVAICAGQSATLTASGGTSFSWNTGATTASITVSPTLTAVFSVTVTDANGCTAAASRTVTVNPLPAASISPATVAICAGQSATLTASGGTSFSWNTGATTASITVSPTLTAVFSVTVTDANGCTAAASRTVTVNPLPAASISPVDVTICIGGSATLTASGGTSFSWNTGATTASITVSPTLTAVFSVTVTDANGCTAAASRTVTVNPLPAASISPATVAICAGQSATLTASGGTSFSWNTGATTASITVSPTLTAVFSVTVTDANGCTAAASRTVTVNPLPAASISPADVTICIGGSATLTASGGTSFSWNTGATTASITVSPSFTTTFSVIVTSASGCTASASRIVNVNQSATASITPVNPTICAGNSVTLTASGGASFSWNTGATTASITGTPVSTATFSVTVTDASGCTATASSTVTVNSNPTAAISPAAPSACNGQNLTLTASGGGTYSWSTGVTTAVITVTVVSASTFVVTVTAANGCTATARVTINLITCDDLDACTTDNCEASGCIYRPINCTDNDLCTTDGCSGGVCQHVAVVCDDGDACTDDLCSLGNCISTPITCTDGNLCTIDSCFNGICIFPPVDCNDDSVCTFDFCQADVCQHTPIANCCEDTSDCFAADACTIEACLNNRCYYTAACCDDGDNCTWDFCQNGGCVFVPKVCEDNDPCTDNACTNGVCAFPLSTCDDGDACTTDNCFNGKCSHAQLVCDDDNPCTHDACVNGNCSHPPVQLNVFIDKTDMTCNSAGQSQFVLDFAGLPHGTILNEQYAAMGIHISGDAANSSTLDQLIVFNTFVTGSPDPDLQVGIGNIAVIPSSLTDVNGDMLVDVPNDYPKGGMQIYTFDTPREVISFKFIDQEGSPGTATAYDALNNVIKTVPIPPAGDASVQTIIMNAQGVSKLVIAYNESGGLTQIVFGCGFECCDGAASAAASGGTAPYSYRWDNGQTTSSLSNLCPGRYCVTITDANGCTGTSCILIGNNSSQCNDGDPCTVDACLAPCAYTLLPGCQPCFAVTGFTLVYESTYGIVGPLTDGMVIDRNVLCRFNVRADVCGQTTRSVKFVLNGNTFRIENVVPFALAGDNPPGNYFMWRPAPGSYTLTAIPYKQPYASGVAGNSLTVTFTVTGPAANTSLVCSQPPSVDCNGDAYGSAFIDNCGVCAGGNTGVIPNSACGCISFVSITAAQLQPYCQGAYLTLTAAGPSHSTYSWSSGASSMSIQANPGTTYSLTLTDGYGCTASASYTTPPVSDLLSAYVMIAQKEILMQKSTVFSGGAGVTGSAGKIKMENASMITAPGTFARAKTITLSGGSAAAVQILIPVSAALPPFESNMSPAAGMNINVLAGTSVTLTGSTYGNITVFSNATLIFMQPAVDIQSLTTKENVTIKFAPQCAKLRIKYTMDLGADNIFNSTAMDVTVFAGGKVKVWDRSNVIADIYTLSELEVEEGTPAVPTVMKGLYIANNIIAEEYSHFYINPACNCRQMPAASRLGADEDSEPAFLAAEPADEKILMEAFPNPFSDRLHIGFSIPEDAKAELEIYNVSGQRIATLFDGFLKAYEKHWVEYRPRFLSTGMIIYRLKTAGGTFYGKAVRVR